MSFESSADYDPQTVVNLAMLLGRSGRPLSLTKDWSAMDYYRDLLRNGWAPDPLRDKITGRIVRAVKESQVLRIESAVSMIDEGVAMEMPDYYGLGRHLGDININLWPRESKSDVSLPHAYVDFGVQSSGAIVATLGESIGIFDQGTRAEMREILGHLCVPHLVDPAEEYRLIQDEMLDPVRSMQVGMYALELIAESEVQS